jgi:hypothetical protein
MAHPWFCEDLHPEALSFNEQMIKESLANLPSPQMLQEVRCCRCCASLVPGPTEGGPRAAEPCQGSERSQAIGSA